MVRSVRPYFGAPSFDGRRIRPQGYDPYPVFATIQKTVIADVLTLSTSGHGNVLRRQDAAHTINNGYYQPYVEGSCASDFIQGPQDDSAVAFPIPWGMQTKPALNQSESNISILGIYSFVYPGISKNDILDTPGSLETNRLRWVELPQDPFNGSAIGAVILLPRSIANSTQEILVCNLGAGWGSSIINTSSYDGGTTFTASIIDLSAVQQIDRAIVPNGADGNQTKYNVGGEAEITADASINDYERPSFPGKPIIVPETWADYLNPFVPALNTTVIDVLMSTTYGAVCQILGFCNSSTGCKSCINCASSQRSCKHRRQW